MGSFKLKGKIYCPFMKENLNIKVNWPELEKTEQKFIKFEKLEKDWNILFPQLFAFRFPSLCPNNRNTEKEPTIEEIVKATIGNGHLSRIIKTNIQIIRKWEKEKSDISKMFENYDEVFEFWIPGVCLTGNVEEFFFHVWLRIIIFFHTGISLLGFIGNLLSAVILSRLLVLTFCDVLLDNFRPAMSSPMNTLLLGLTMYDTVLILTSVLMVGVPSIHQHHLILIDVSNRFIHKNFWFWYENVYFL